MIIKTVAAAAALAVIASTSVADPLRAVGSSTVFPFATTVAEALGRGTDIQTPVIESTGTGGGFKLFCSGIGKNTPDLTNASRAIKQSEVDNCAKNGVTPVEVFVGYDGIVLANDKEGEQLDVTKRQLFLALAAKIPNDQGVLIPNPHVKWSDIDRNLPNVDIVVYGPPPTSGTRDAFLELVMETGAKSFKSLADLRKRDKKAFKTITHHMREDGAFIEAGENDNLIVQKLQATPDAYGIFGFSFLDQNNDVVQGAIINGVEPTFDNIVDQSYQVSRPLFFYAKAQHVDSKPELVDYIELFLSDQMAGQEGALVDKGLIPMSDEDRQKMLDRALTALN